ncbi:MAG: serine hydrolase [Candidatus Longimicrobiales bacterium M2_2A_002]
MKVSGCQGTWGSGPVSRRSTRQRPRRTGDWYVVRRCLRRCLRGLLPLVLSSAVAACAPDAGAPPAREGAALTGFQADVEQVLDRLPIPGFSIAVSRGDSVLWARGYGVADAATGRPASVRTPYRIGSITKPMAATVILRLAGAGALSLDDPPSLYLDRPPDWASDVTIRQLLSHTSEGPEPGRHFAYSGRYNVLSLVAGSAAGRPFPELLERWVFEPAGMTSTTAIDRLSGSWLADSLAAPHGPEGKPAPDASLPDEASGGNGVVSTVLDLTRFVDALADGRLIGPDMLEAAWTPAPGAAGAADTGAREGGPAATVGRAPLPYGLGWFVEPTAFGTLVWHGGQWPYYSGLLLHVPDRDLTLAVLASSWHVSHPYYAIGTGTVLYHAVAASFLRHMVLTPALADTSGPIPDIPWGVPADSLAAIGDAVRGRLPPSVVRFWGAELLGRGLLYREAGDPGRADSLMAAAVACCPAALGASADLGLLFHLGRSGDPELRRIGQAAGEALIARRPDAVLPRFHLAVSLVQGGDGDRAVPILESLMADPAAPAWLRGWVTYFRAEQLADDDPERAIRLLRQVLDRGVDESGLLADTRALLAELEGEPGAEPGG